MSHSITSLSVITLTVMTLIILRLCNDTHNNGTLPNGAQCNGTQPNDTKYMCIHQYDTLLLKAFPFSKTSLVKGPGCFESFSYHIFLFEIVQFDATTFAKSTPISFDDLDRLQICRKGSPFLNCRLSKYLR